MELKRRCFLALLAGMALLAGCSREKKTTDRSHDAWEQTAGGVTGEGEGQNRENEKDTEENQGCLRLYVGEISSEVSPFFYLTAGDERLLSLLYRRVEDGENGIADVEVIRKKTQGQKKPTGKKMADRKKTAGKTQSSGSGHTVYRITVKENVRDQDGNRLTADDLLFNYTLRCQLDYRGLDHINQMNIIGLEQYQYGASGKTLKLRKKKVQERLSKPAGEIEKKLRQEIILPALKRQYAWTESLYLDSSQKKLTDKYPQTSMLFARYFAPDTNYTGKGKSKKQVLNDVASQYKGDIKKLARITGEDEMVEACCLVIRQIWKKQTAEMGTIAGIRKKDDRTIEIETADYQKEDRERLGSIYFVSRHTASSSETGTGLPAGCGIYYLEKKTEAGMRLASNRFDQKAGSGIKSIYLTGAVTGKGEDVTVECVREISEGKLDMAIVSERISKEKANLKKELKEEAVSWKVAADGGVLYSTSRVNATTLPDKMTAAEDVLEQIGRLKLNE